MIGEHKNYGFEGGYEDWTADRVFKNMRVMKDGKEIADVQETEDNGKVEGADD